MGNIPFESFCVSPICLILFLYLPFLFILSKAKGQSL
jgi:hypothetical protein